MLFRSVSTTPYYRFCEDVISEVCEVFGNPRLFHLGMDEETYGHQSLYNMVIIRQSEQWWYDLNYLVRTTLPRGARPWIWSDYIWHHEEEFLRKMSRDVLQSNWYYGGFEEDDSVYIRGFAALEQGGFEQVPAGSVWSRRDNFEKIADYAAEHLDKTLLTGMMQTVWRPMMANYADRQAMGVQTLGETKMHYEALIAEN